MKYRITSYNIENMRQLFKKNRFTEVGMLKAEAAASTLAETTPHIAGIVEASDRIGDHHYFLKNTPLSPFGFQVAKSAHKRGKQDLVLYYREPFEVVSMDENVTFYNDWLEDIDNDSIKEQLHFERRPFEVVFRNTTTGLELLIILVSFKSKGVFTTTDIHEYEYLALANRKKLYGQAKKVRERVDVLLDEDPDRAFIVMGDVNDEPGLDHFEKILGASAVETITGSIYFPKKILHNTLWHYMESGRQKELWTTEYPDRIVKNLNMHQAWLDHIFVSPAMLNENNGIHLVKNSGAIGSKTDLAKAASDHFPIYCDVRM